MAIDEFKNLLKQTMGLDAESVGVSAIERAVRRRQTVCRLQDLKDYLDLARASETELQELIEAVVVPETWFFRDREVFAALSRVTLQEWLPDHPEGKIQLFSAPCSTGEEAYSMAMTLLDTGLPADRFRIDAVDISARGLAQARRALYGQNSFRGGNLDFRERHFRSTEQGHHLSEAVRNQVTFHQGNLLDSNFHAGRPRYDIIFCRNLLIYFDRPTQARLLQMLDRLLADKGWLFVGPAETAPMTNHNFVSAKLPMAFAFRRAHVIPRARLWPPVTRRGKAQQPAPTVVSTAQAHSGDQPLASTPKTLPARANLKSNTDLEQAHRLADAGRLREAAEICQAHLRDNPSAKAFYLLGLMRDAEGDSTAAEESYRKALYLDPTHYEALMHLAYLSERTGDPIGAQVLRKRAGRIKERSGKY